MTPSWLSPCRLSGETMDAFMSRRVRACRHLGKEPDARLSTSDLDELIHALGDKCPKGLQNLRASLLRRYGAAPAWTNLPIAALARLLAAAMKQDMEA